MPLNFPDIARFAYVGLDRAATSGSRGTRADQGVCPTFSPILSLGKTKEATGGGLRTLLSWRLPARARGLAWSWKREGNSGLSELQGRSGTPGGLNPLY